MTVLFRLCTGEVNSYKIVKKKKNKTKKNKKIKLFMCHHRFEIFYRFIAVLIELQLQRFSV